MILYLLILLPIALAMIVYLLPLKTVEYGPFLVSLACLSWHFFSLSESISYMRVN